MPSVGSHNIEVYARVRPIAEYVERGFGVNLDDNELEFETSRAALVLGGEEQRRSAVYGFTKVLGEKTEQDEVFEVIGRKAVNTFIEGLNATVFAYGQTGSGKTHTLTGAPEGSYQTRGLIPRAITAVFDAINAQRGGIHRVTVSYLQLYQGKAWDLLTFADDPDADENFVSDISNLRRVKAYADADNVFQFPELSLHPATSAADATKLMWKGDTQRIIAETPSNPTSTRSHCIFTMYLEHRVSADSATMTQSKLHLVDLAGSERVWKSDITGELLSEAKYINASLYTLQGVIRALAAVQRGEQTHVPYRNGFLTMFLKDSLGGNSFTQMIATLSPSIDQLNESLSTCEFARVVASITNDSRRIQSLDLKSLVAHLKKQVRQLKKENALLLQQLGRLRGTMPARGPITDGEKQRLIEAVKQFLSEPITASDPIERKLKVLDWVPSDMTHLHEVFFIFKSILGLSGDLSALPVSHPPLPTSSSTQMDNRKVVELQELVELRDSEIEVLCDLNSKQQARIVELERLLGTDAPPRYSTDSESDSEELYEVTTHNVSSEYDNVQPKPAGIIWRKGDLPLEWSLRDRTEFLKDKEECLRFFYEHYSHSNAIQQNKETLQTMFGEAKTLAQALRRKKEATERLKKQAEDLRRLRADLLVKGEPDIADGDAKAERLREDLLSSRDEYKSRMSELRRLKTEIESLETTLQQQRLRSQDDWRDWIERQMELIRIEVTTGAPPTTQSPSQFKKLSVNVDSPSPFDVSGARPSTPPRSSRPGSRQAYLSPRAAPAPRRAVRPIETPSVEEERAPLMTGNEFVDSKIQEFYAARDRLLARH